MNIVTDTYYTISSCHVLSCRLSVLKPNSLVCTWIVISFQEGLKQRCSQVQMDLVSMNKILSEVQRLTMQQREFLIKILEACVTLKTHVEAELTNSTAHVDLTESRDFLTKARMNLSVADSLADVQTVYSSLNIEKQRLQSRYQVWYKTPKNKVYTYSFFFNFTLNFYF